MLKGTEKPKVRCMASIGERRYYLGPRLPAYDLPFYGHNDVYLEYVALDDSPSLFARLKQRLFRVSNH